MNKINWRVNLVLVLIFFFGAAILARLFFLQIVHHQFYKALAEGQQKILTPTIGERGEIFFRDGTPVAVNKKGEYLFICPKEIKEKEKTAKILAEVLKLDFDWVLEKTQKANLFEAIKHHLSEEEQALLKEKNLPGVYLEEEIFRYYPQENLTSHITGFLGGEGKGQYGLEGYYDEILKGKEMITEKEKESFGYFSLSGLRKKNKGRDIVLTIDPDIQFMANNLLSKSQEKLDFKGGQVLVLNPNSGAILALAQIPNFDPNRYSKIENPEIFQNAVIQKIFEPGSIFKPIVMAAALNEGKITPKTSYIDEGKVQVGGWTIYNYDRRTWGERTMTEVLEKSINTGAVFVEQTIGHETFLKYIEKFGLFEKTGIDLQGEVFSENQEFKKGYEINFATASFGQGIEITPIQIARAFAAIANGGKLIKPHIVEKILEDGKEIKRESDFEKRQVISKKTASQLTAMLVSVVENGFGKAARVENYFIAGKTGTAQVPWPALGINKAGYSSETTQTFIGFFPAFDPQFLILVKLDNPKTRTAEYSAVPLFRELAKYIIDYQQILPDHEE